jgi:hypothetical protein
LRDIGLPWSRSQLADLEIGRRQELNMGEVILLAETFGVPLRDLVPDGGAVQLGSTERPAALVHAMLGGQPPLDLSLGGPVDIPGLSPDLFGPGPYWVRADQAGSQIFANGEVQVARRLGVPVEKVHAAAQQLWDGRIFDVHRDRVLQQRRRRHSLAMARRGALGAGPQPDPRDVDEELIGELRDAIEEPAQGHASTVESGPDDHGPSLGPADPLEPA